MNTSTRSIALVLSAVAFFALPLKGQLLVGGQFGLNLGTVHVDPEPSSEEYSMLLGFAVGGVVNTPLAGGLEFQAQPMVTRKGTKIKESGDEVQFKVTYLDLPLLLVYKFTDEGEIQPYALSGPSVSLLLAAKVEVPGGGEFDIKDETETLDLGIGLGAGVRIPQDDLVFFADLRYVLGLLNLNAEEGEATVKNRGLLLSAGLMVPLSK